MLLNSIQAAYVRGLRNPSMRVVKCMGMLILVGTAPAGLMEMGGGGMPPAAGLAFSKKVQANNPAADVQPTTKKPSLFKRLFGMAKQPKAPRYHNDYDMISPHFPYFLSRDTNTLDLVRFHIIIVDSVHGSRGW